MQTVDCTKVPCRLYQSTVWTVPCRLYRVDCTKVLCWLYQSLRYETEVPRVFMLAKRAHAHFKECSLDYVNKQTNKQKINTFSKNVRVLEMLKLDTAEKKMVKVRPFMISQNGVTSCTLTLRLKRWQLISGDRSTLTGESRSTMKIIHTRKDLGIISEDTLKRDLNTEAINKKGHQRLHLLRKLRSFHVDRTIHLSYFVESVLSFLFYWLVLYSWRQAKKLIGEKF